jgi:soluble lytic murein transglycosylase-like protein
MTRSRPPPRLAAFAALLAIALLAPTDSAAQDDPPSAEVAPAEPAAEPSAAPATAPEAAPADADAIDWKVEAARAKDEALAAKRAYDSYRDATDPTAKRLAIFAGLLAITNVLLTAFKTAVKLTSRGKKYLPWVAMGAGVATGLLAKLAAGEPTMMAIFYGMGPPGSVLAQELLGWFKKPKDASAPT